MTVRTSFWNEEIETMAPAARRRLESERLQAQIAYNYRTSPFLAAKLDSAGVKPSDIRSVEDLARIPFMEKSEIASSQKDGTLLGANQCAPLDDIVRIQATGGTTGQPMRIGLTRQDIADYLGLTIETVSRMLTQLQHDGRVALDGTRRFTITHPRLPATDLAA